LQKDEKTHSLKVNDRFNPVDKDGVTRENIFVIGDCSSLEAKLPATAQGEFELFALCFNSAV
jgi:NADH dehydrogenase